MVNPVFYIADVFAEQKYAGNQLAVIRHSSHESSDRMQAIAREMHFSETTFIISEQERNGGYDVRIFTPEKEIPFAGHPTLGTASIIRQEIIGRPVPMLTLNLKAGQIPVSFDESSGLAWMKQLPPQFAGTIEPRVMAEVISLSTEDIDARFPTQSVSTGTPFFIVPLRTLSALKRARINTERHKILIEKSDAKAILIFCPEPQRPGHDLSVRVFADYYGVPEDPATGSANGCLAGYLAHYRYFGRSAIDARVDQGYEISRPSLLYLKADEQNAGIEIFVGGKVIVIARGELV
jgi:trans-2,3-dihydro-3-hydroxyanthranilate isomerase